MKENIIDLIKNILKLDINKRITIDEALNNNFFKDEIDNNYCEYCINMVNKNNKEDKYKMIENFKICAICNKKKDEKNVECDICGNYLHVKCLDFLCTCQKEIRESELIKKINNCIFINEKINDN